MGKRTKDLSIVVSLRTLVAFRALYAVVALSSREVRFLNQRHKILPSAFAEAIAGRANKTEIKAPPCFCRCFQHVSWQHINTLRLFIDLSETRHRVGVAISWRHVHDKAKVLYSNTYISACAARVCVIIVLKQHNF